MKRVCSVLLVLCLMLSFTACGETAEPEESGIALPFGLKFGMTYDEFAAKLSENGLTAAPLKPASNNDGYFPDGVESDDLWVYGLADLAAIANENLSAREREAALCREELSARAIRLFEKL